MPQVRGSRGRAWFHANWGYEESKHSMALGDWLLRSDLPAAISSVHVKVSAALL
jgi:hypothetical protein